MEGNTPFYDPVSICWFLQNYAKNAFFAITFPIQKVFQFFSILWRWKIPYSSKKLVFHIKEQLWVSFHWTQMAALPKCSFLKFKQIIVKPFHHKISYCFPLFCHYWFKILSSEELALCTISTQKKLDVWKYQPPRFQREESSFWISDG